MSIWSYLFQCDQNTLPPAEALSAGAIDEMDSFAEARHRMVERQLRARGISDPNVLRVMGRVSRHRFVAKHLQHEAYDDHPLPIGLGQTISQPYIVALMTQLASPTSDCRALEVGLGSGYQTAILAELCQAVFAIEINRPLVDETRVRLAAMGYQNVTIRCDDGYQGWREQAPFGIILVTAAPQHVPGPLIEQLAIGGRMVIPVGRDDQELLLIEKHSDGTPHYRTITAVQFVPMTGQAEEEGLV